ncbi:MAG: uracil-DNA glycosylase family protein [Ignavibacteria bacterium]|nr:uracil-DNA glycosylase family protein [Ignavibacteria bacterium]
MKSIKEIQSCRNCNLCANQKPLLDKSINAEVFWVGLSAVKVNNVKSDTPLSPRTNTGKLISEIEKCNQQYRFYKTNLVKCLPLDNDKIRYPNKAEMNKCYSNLDFEIRKGKPKIVILLGKVVIDFVSKIINLTKAKLNDNFNYETFKIDDTIYIPVHHPSYILVYKRKRIEEYIGNISQILANFVIS